MPDLPAIPAVMRALELRAYGQPLVVVERPVPKLEKGEVLVKIAASPVNPSDLAFLKGNYVQKPLPVVPGFEASGTVVSTASGLARALLGRRVACSAPQNGDGTWAQFMKTAASMCFPLLPSVGTEAGASLIVNPLTALALLDVAKRLGAKAIVQTAAASALGRMMLRVAKRRRVPMIHVVRRPAQVAMLRALGAEQVLDSSEKDFDAQLKDVCAKAKASVALDAVSGTMTGRLIDAMPRGSTVIVYGGLAEEPLSANPGQLIFGDKTIEGFWLASWIRKRGIGPSLRAGVAVQRRVHTDFRTEVRARLGLDEAVAGIDAYAQAMSEGKVLLLPNGSLS